MSSDIASPKETRVGIVGAAGRMGRMLAQQTLETHGLRLAAVTEHEAHPDQGRDMGELLGIPPLGLTIGADNDALVKDCDVLIDFTKAELTAELAPKAAAAGCRLVIGTTGLNDEQKAAIQDAARHIPLVWAPNMSVGVNVLFRLAAQAAKLLGLDYDIEIVETHHRHKKDAPSGTAMGLAAAVASATPDAGLLAERLKHGRSGIDPHERHQIGMHAVRGGDVVGDHTVLFATDGERVELTHRASNRQTFSRGAIRAACWLMDKAPGQYTMQDVLGLR